MSAAVKTLIKTDNPLADPHRQTLLLEDPGSKLRTFESKLAEYDLGSIHPAQLEVLQLNLGKLCNQTCKHCHVDAGPGRKEVMSRETMEHCLDILDHKEIHTVDLTGGAPEMNPDFRWFVEQLKAYNKHVIVRCNLTIILHNHNYHDLPGFYRENNIEVISSLPFYKASRTDAQRGDGVFDKSIKALQLLNKEGYGMEGSGLILNLVYNPSGAFLPAPQEQLEKDFKQELYENFGIAFNNLYNITNLPVSRFLDYLIVSGNYELYMEKLIDAFNPAAVSSLMCRNTLSVGWDGWLYDCDFNQMLDLNIIAEEPMHISKIDLKKLSQRRIRSGRHCFGCTAGAGSSCGGAVV